MTKEEDILHALRRLEAMSRRKSDMPEPPNGEMPIPNGAVPPPPPRHQGRGRMLSVLNDCGPMSQSQLAARLDIRPQSLSELLSKAEAEGLVERRQSDEDKRQTIVSITHAGQNRISVFREAHRKKAEEFCSPLTEEEKNTLKILLDKLIAAKDEKEQDERKQEV